jgi:hypothetical protein
VADSVPPTVHQQPHKGCSCQAAGQPIKSAGLAEDLDTALIASSKSLSVITKDEKYDEKATPPLIDAALNGAGRANRSDTIHTKASNGSLGSKGASSSLEVDPSDRAYQDSSRPSSKSSDGSNLRWNCPPHYKQYPALADDQKHPSLGKLDHDELSRDYILRSLSVSETSDSNTVDTQQASDIDSNGSQNEADSTDQISRSRPTVGEIRTEPCFPDDVTPAYPEEKKDEETAQGGPVDTNHNQEKNADLTPYYEKILNKRREVSSTRKRIIMAAKVASVLAVIAIIVLLSLTKSKQMARGSFLGGILVIQAAVIAGMVSACTRWRLQSKR